MRSGILKSTPFRLILWIASALIIGLVIAGIIAVVLIRDELLVRTDRDITDTYNVIAQSFVEDDAQDLSDLVASHVRATVADNEIYLLAAPDGSIVSGNIPAVELPSGFVAVPADQLGLVGAGGDYRILTGMLREYRLSVGTSLRSVDDVGGIVVTALGWTIGGLAIVVAAIGFFAAASGQRRLDSIADTMGMVARGDLKARIPLSGHGDDIDILVSSVNAALDRLAALVEGMRQVSVDIAHELKTPLNRLSIAVTGAIDARDNGREVMPMLEEAEREVRQVISIFDAMLRIAQIEAGARRARFARVELGKILDSVGDAYEAVAADAGQILTVSVGDDLGSVLGDKDLLTQMLANLIENCIRHCPEGAHISVSGRLDNGRPFITVSDNGPGISDGDKLRVFDRLYRVEKSRTTSGNGLGLSLVKAVADLHGAGIVLRDNNPGLSVEIRFPPAPPVALGPAYG